VTATLGWEQGYFLIDRALANSRPDLMMTGRTLLGHTSAKGQQLDDHYFGSIPTRALVYMRDLEQECMLLGLLKTRINKSNANQFEFAPIFEKGLSSRSGLSVDGCYGKVAERHD
jgi:glutamine synthetase